MKRKTVLVVLSLVLCLCVALFLSACHDDEVESLYRPVNIQYDGSRITWDRVTLAEHYTVSINGGEAKRVNTNMFTYDAEGGDFDVTVNSVIKGKSFGADMHFTALDKITTINVSDSGELSWTPVVGATAYRVSVNGEIQVNDVTEARFTPKTGSNLIKIKPVVTGDNSYYSAWSDEKQVNINEAPSAINYDGEFITWRGNSAKYIVSVNGIAQESPVTGTKLAYDFAGKQMIISVKALGDHLTTFDSAATEKTYYFLENISNMAVEDGILKWDPVEGAEGYQIRINGFLQNASLKTNSYEDLKPAERLEIEIRPYNNSGNYFSTWSNAKSFQILDAPVLEWNTAWDADAEDTTKNLSWNSVGNEHDFTVIVEKDGQVVVNENINEPQFGYNYAQAGSYTVKVRANAVAGGAWSNSKFSACINIIRLAGPQKASSDYIKSDSVDLTKGFTVSFTKVTHASRYQLYVVNGGNKTPLDGAATTKDSLTYGNYTSETAQTYNYILKSEGETGVKNVNGGKQVILPCRDDAALSFQIQVQAMPSKPVVNGFIASWTGVGENGSAVRCDSRVLNADITTSTNISSLSAGSHQLSVCVKGNGANVLASKYTPSITVIRLAAPTGIRISGGASDGELTFTGVANASGYQIYFNGEANPVSYDELNGIKDYILNNGTSVQVEAVADTTKNEEDLFYINSEKSTTKQFICLNAPTFSSSPFDENMVNLRWNKPSNVTNAFTPTYDVYDYTVAIEGAIDIRATSANIESFTAGEHQLKVKAKGDGESFLDSEFSEVLKVTKLTTPTMKVQDNLYTWESVDLATSYSLKIDGVDAAFALQEAYGAYAYSPAGKLTAVKTYKVELFAKGDGRTTINSNKLTFNQKVNQCIAPEIAFEYSHEQVTHGGTIDVRITKESPNNNGYYYEIGGASGKFTSVASVPAENTGNYSIKAKALGGSFSNLSQGGIVDADYAGIFYIDSQYTTSRTLTLLGYPSSTFGLNGISMTSGSVLSWSVVKEANGYDYQISLDGGDFSPVKHVATTSLGRADYLPTGKTHNDYTTITIRVRASSNGSPNVVSSAWVEYTWTNPSK